jgi:hypothetical protein
MNPVLVSIAPLASFLIASSAHADAITDWNQFTVEATKGFVGNGGAGVALDSNLGTRIEAIEARATFDAVNAINHFSAHSYYYTANATGSVAAAVAQAAHDVVLTELPNPANDPSADPRWGLVRAWVDSELAAYLTSLVGISPTDGGIAAGAAAAAAAVAARAGDHSSPVTSYGADLTPTSNPGIGRWRQSNAGASYVNPLTLAPTGFDATGLVILPRAGIDFNWPSVTLFSLPSALRNAFVGTLPALSVNSAEYQRELAYVKRVGEDTSTSRTSDQTAQALFYKQDAEIFVNEAARIGSLTRHLSVDKNAALFALLDDAVADARIAAWASKYGQLFWRPITALNADADGGVTNGHAAWHPVAATPAHPGNTSGHSTTVAAGFEVLRMFFGSDAILGNGQPATLGSLSWLAGTNNGTGNVATRSVATFTQAQLEAGASRIYLGVHFGFDNLQGQLLGLEVADAILLTAKDPAAAGLLVPGILATLAGDALARVTSTLLGHTESSGYFGETTGS